MATLKVLVGIPGSGKSTLAKSLADENTFIASSDDLREELLGDANTQNYKSKIFDILHKRAKDALKAGNDVILDSTNMNSAKRAALIQDMYRAVPGIRTECHLVLCPIEECIARQDLRGRKVPTEDIIRLATGFAVPGVNEKWDLIYVHNPFQREGLLAEYIETVAPVEQYGKWHQENVGDHHRLAVKYAEDHGYDPLVCEVLSYHDIGKGWTRTVDADGNTHFTGHANVGAYMYLCAEAPTGELTEYHRQRAQLIEHHMAYMLNWKPETVISRVGEQIYGLIEQMHNSDTSGSIKRSVMQDIDVLTFMNSFSDWEDRIAQPPYNVRVKHEGDYVLLKYSQIESDFSTKVVQQSRGSIFKKNEDGVWEYVCRPFDKFFNVGEANAAEIDWNTARVLEKVDGCFSGEDCVIMSDGSKMPFKAIHTHLSAGEDLSVLSYNFDTKKVEPKRILHVKRSECTRPDEWITIRYRKLLPFVTQYSSRVSRRCVTTVTKNHVMYVMGGDNQIHEKLAGDIQTGDRILGVASGLTAVERQVILGSLLGNAACNKIQSYDHKAIQFVHSEVERDYAQYKCNLLQRIGGEVHRYTTRELSEGVRYISKALPSISNIYEDTHYNEQKNITERWLDNLNWLGFAVWYMDCGSMDEELMQLNILCAHCEAIRISDYYEKAGLPNVLTGARSKYIITFTTKASETLWARVRFYIPGCMQHKLPEKHRGYYSPIIDKDVPELELYCGTVAEVTPGFHAHKYYGCEDKYKFDIEVEDNHNYFCQGALVHNSLMKIWCDDGKWHLSTNGTINAMTAEVADRGFTFGDVFNRALGFPYYKLGAHLDPDYTYMFELTSPDARVVIPYEDGVYYLSRRHNQTGKEVFDIIKLPGVKHPKQYQATTLDNVIKLAEKMSKDEEGFVVSDAHGNRIKVKSPEYLIAAHMANNNVISNRNLVTYLQENKLDDFLAYCPQHKHRVDDLLQRLGDVCTLYEDEWVRLKPLSSFARKEFAEYASISPAKSYLFECLKNPKLKAADFLLSCRTNTLMRILGFKEDSEKSIQEEMHERDQDSAVIRTHPQSCEDACKPE